MPLQSPDDEPPPLLFAIIKAAVAAGLLSALAVHWLSPGPLDRASLARLAAEAAGEPPTGSTPESAGDLTLGQ